MAPAFKRILLKMSGEKTGRSPNRAGVYDWIPPGGRQRPDQRHKVHMRKSEVTIPKLAEVQAKRIEVEVA